MRNWQRGERLILRWYALDARRYESPSEALRFGYLTFPTTPKTLAASTLAAHAWSSTMIHLVLRSTLG